MKFAKPPISFEAQVELLVSRGMSIPDPARACRYLAHINYYRLRAYWLPLEQSGGNAEHRFRPGTCFDDALALYLFDRKFRLLVIEAIERIEVSFRTQFAHVLAMRYGSHPHLNSDLFFHPEQYQRCLKSLSEEVCRSSETFIEHYRTRYLDPEIPPIWAACEVMSFGQLSRWFNNLKYRRDRQDIATIYQLDEKVLASLMHHLTHVRNLAAHHSRLWNRRLTFTMRQPQRPIKLRRDFNPAADRNIYNTQVMLGYLLKVSSPGTSWVNRLRQLLNEYPQASPAAMGFPGNWQTLPFWEGQL